jgi:FixJ family two-component response regulator
MLSHDLQAQSSQHGRPDISFGGNRRYLSGVAYIVIDDERLTNEIRAAVESHGFRAHCFRSGFQYLAYRRPGIASCLLISGQLADMTGLDLQRMTAGTQGPPIIFLSNEGDIPSCVRAIKEGALDFLTLPFVSSHLLEAVETAFRKDHAALAVRRQDEDLRNRWRSLTSREAEVMRYAVAGFLNKQTAAELKIAENTVQVHRGRVMRKMQADSFATLVRMSLRLADCGEPSLLHAPPEPAWDYVARSPLTM